MSTTPKARFLQGPENSTRVDNGAAAVTVGDLLIMSSQVVVAATDGTQVCGIAGEDMAISATKKKMELLMPGALWLFTKGSGTTINVWDDIVAAGSGLVDGGTSADPAIGYRVQNGAESTTLVCCLIWPHTKA